MAQIAGMIGDTCQPILNNNVFRFTHRPQIYSFSTKAQNRHSLGTPKIGQFGEREFWLSRLFLPHHHRCCSAYGGLICFQRVSNQIKPMPKGPPAATRKSFVSLKTFC